MAIRLTKTSKVVFALSILLLSATLGYLVWRVNQPETVAPQESEAGGEIPVDPRGVPVDKYSCACCDDVNNKIFIPVSDQVWNSGTWIETCEEACSDQGGWRATSDNNCGIPVNECFCEIWGAVSGDYKSCGWFCKFPSGTQEAVEAKAKSTCSPYVAMCKYVQDGPNQVIIEEYNTSQACYGLIEQCDNPYSDDLCVEISAVCGDGKIDDGETCDPTATPTGCASGELCGNDCICSSPSRPSLCGSTTISPATLTDGQSATMTSQTNGGTANYFTFAVYNMDNLYPAGDPKPVCVPGSVTWANNCPTGTMPLIFSDPNISTRTSGTVTFTAEQIFVNDAFWNNQKVDSVRISAYFMSEGALISLPDVNCQELLQYVLPEQPTPEQPTPEQPAPPAGETVPQTGLFDSTLGRISVGFVLLTLGFFVYNLPSYYFIRKPKKVDYTYREKFERKISK